MIYSISVIAILLSFSNLVFAESSLTSGSQNLAERKICTSSPKIVKFIHKPFTLLAVNNARELPILFGAAEDWGANWRLGKEKGATNVQFTLQSGVLTANVVRPQVVHGSKAGKADCILSGFKNSNSYSVGTYKISKDGYYPQVKWTAYRDCNGKESLVVNVLEGTGKNAKQEAPGQCTC